MIEVVNLNKTYGNKQVLSNVSFTAENGIVTGFVGPNGAGKSTTMRMIACLERPDSGQAYVDGVQFSKAAHPLNSMGVYLGSEYLPNHMTANEYLSYLCTAGGISKNEIPKLLEVVQIAYAADKPIASYSLGMRQRIGLAGALLGNPSTIMLDEPINGLDPMGVQWVRDVVRTQAKEGRAVLLSSHLLSELELVADKVVMLSQGAVIRQGSMSQLVGAVNGPTHVLMHTGNDPKLAAYLTRKKIPVHKTDDGILVEGIAPEKLAKLVLRADLDLYRLEEKKPTLEELFMSSTAQAAQAPYGTAYQQAPVQYQQAPQQTPYPYNNGREA